MSSESGWRSIIARPDGGVSVLCASGKRQGAASVDALLNRVERKAAPGVLVERVPVDKAPSARSLRNAWVISDGKIAIDLAKARRMKARQWARQGAELRRFIHDELIPYSQMLGDRNALTRLEAATTQVAKEMEYLTANVSTMTESELASHVPGWPQLSGSP